MTASRPANLPSGSAQADMSGTLERKTEPGLYAYRLSERDKSEAERLRQYILQQHRLTHPGLHI